MTSTNQTSQRHGPVEEAAWVLTLILLVVASLVLTVGDDGVLAWIGSLIGLAGIVAAGVVFTQAVRGGSDSSTLPALVVLALLALLARGITVWG